MPGNQAHVPVDVSTNAAGLDNLDHKFPGVHDLIYSRQHEIPAHINIYVNNQEITNLDGDKTVLSEGDKVAIIPAIAGGSNEAADQGGTLTAAQGGALTAEQVTRYSRHIIMPQVGSAGPRKILGAKVLIVGAGCLGSPVALYLAPASVGTPGLGASDAVHLSHLQPPILRPHQHTTRPRR